MHLTRIFIAAIFLSCEMANSCPPSFSDTVGSTSRTISFFSNGQELSLPPASTYVLVDPLTGVIKGKFDPRSTLSNLPIIQPGLVIIDQPSGKLIGTVDPTGKTIDVASVPATNSLVLAIYGRRCDLERTITDSLAKGNINTTQANLLRAQTDKVASNEFMAKQSGGILTYADALSLAVTLNNIADKLVSYAHAAPVAPLLGSRFAIVNGQIQMVR